MTVEATYDSPSTKEFKVVSESGSKLILDRVFKKLMESEKEATQPAISARTQLNRDNYDFELVGYEPSETGGQYVLRVSPKSRSKYVYRGKVWVDGTDFAVTRIEGEPAQNPSFWTKKSEIHHEYEGRAFGFRPGMSRSATCGWRTRHLTIEYKDYRVTVPANQAKQRRLRSKYQATEENKRPELTLSIRGNECNGDNEMVRRLASQAAFRPTQSSCIRAADHTCYANDKAERPL
jgi:membrane peptidoglycan carboxypeptidase